MILKEHELSELGTMIRAIVREEMGAKEPEQKPELIRRREARALLGGISDPTIISYEKRGLITPKRIGGTILYDRNDLINCKAGKR